MSVLIILIATLVAAAGAVVAAIVAFAAFASVAAICFRIALAILLLVVSTLDFLLLAPPFNSLFRLIEGMVLFSMWAGWNN